jgi:hypothetical protein
MRTFTAALAFTLSLFIVGHTVLGYDATSTSFFIRQNIQGISGGNATSSFSASTTFKEVGAGVQTAIGTSSSASFIGSGGFLKNYDAGPQPSYELSYYHWRNDNGSETTATSGTGGTQNTATSSVPKDTNIRLRMSIANRGGTQEGFSSQQFRIEYGELVTTCSAIATWVDVGAVGGHWDMGDSQSLTDGSTSTNIAIGTGGVTDTNAVFSGTGAVKDTGSQTSAISLASNKFVELEYSIKATAISTDSGTYCFRVTNAGSASMYTYNQYPRATLAAGSLTFTVDSGSKVFGIVTPAVVKKASSTLAVGTSNNSGFALSVARDDADTTMDLTTNAATNIPDKTAWVPGTPCTSAGNATASTTQPQTLQFRVNSLGTQASNYCSQWWGTDDTTTNARFAGFPASSQNIIYRPSASQPATDSVVLYNLTVPVTQPTGDYSGGITYTVVANP